MNYDDIFVSPKKKAFDKEKWAQEKKDQREFAYSTIDKMAQSVGADGAALQKYLNVQSRFDRYTVGNALLVMAQMPTATKLAEFGEWRERGAFLKAKKPVIILKPGNDYERDDGSTGTSFDPTRVYDISQTSLRRETQAKAAPDMRTLLAALVSNAPVAIKPTEGISGASFEPEQGEILVQPGMTAEDLFLHLSTALSHAELAGGDTDYDPGENGFHAYCAAYMLCKRHGIDTKSFNFEGAPGFFEGTEVKEIREELTKPQQAARGINERISQNLYQKERQSQSHEER